MRHILAGVAFWFAFVAVSPVVAGHGVHLRVEAPGAGHGDGSGDGGDGR